MPKEATSKRRIDTDEPLLYELKGIVVHSGQFSFGHYYSFAKDPITGKWLKLDDDQVSEFDLADLESECFGGIQTTVNKWTNCVYKTEKTASAYMLFYQRCDGPPISTPKKERTTGPREAATPDSVSDTGMDDLQIESPASSMVERVESAAGVDEILDTNEQMLRRSLFFDEGFSGFVLDLVVAMCNLKKTTKETIEMALTVFYKSVLHAENHPRLTTPGGYSKTDWVTTLRRLLENNEEACISFLEMCMRNDDGPDHLPNWLEGGIVACPVEEVRQGFTQLMCVAVRTLAARAEADVHLKNQVKDLLLAFVDALKELVPAISQSWRHLAQFGVLIESMAAMPVWCELMIHKEMLALLLHLYLGQMSPGIKSPHFPKIANMGTTNPWPNGRMEPDCDAMLRGVEILYSSKFANSFRWPQLTQQMVHSCESYLAQKLCTTDPMGGSGNGSDPLIIHMLLVALRNDGDRSQMIEQIRTQLMEQLEKQGVDTATRVRQSQSAQTLARFLKASVTDVVAGDAAQVSQDLRRAKELLLRQLVTLECYQQPHRNLSLNPAKRFAQVLVLAGQDAGVCALFDHSMPQLEQLAQVLIQEQASRQMAGHLSMVVPAGADVGTLLSIIQDTLTRARQNHLPNELYVSVTTQEAAVKGVYRIDGPTSNAMSSQQAEHHAGLTYVKTVDHNVGYHIAKVLSPTPPTPPTPDLVLLRCPGCVLVFRTRTHFSTHTTTHTCAHARIHTCAHARTHTHTV